MLGTCPPMGPNSFIFAYIFTKKHPCRRSMPPLMGACPPMGNPGSATELWDSVMKEVKLGRMLGPFPVQPIDPLHLSHPWGVSINSFINPEDCKTNYQTLDMALKLGPPRCRLICQLYLILPGKWCSIGCLLHPGGSTGEAGFCTNGAATALEVEFFYL